MDSKGRGGGPCDDVGHPAEFHRALEHEVGRDEREKRAAAQGAANDFDVLSRRGLEEQQGEPSDGGPQDQRLDLRGKAHGRVDAEEDTKTGCRT